MLKEYQSLKAKISFYEEIIEGQIPLNPAKLDLQESISVESLLKKANKAK